MRICISIISIRERILCEIQRKYHLGMHGYPVAAVERGKVVLVAEGIQLMVCDHDLAKLP